MKLLLVTDTWIPQVNGVVVTLQHLIRFMQKLGHEVTILEPSQFFTVPLLSYPEIKLALNVWKVAKYIELLKPDCIHICTEGSLGLATMRSLKKKNIPFTTSIHTRLPEYLSKRIPFTLTLAYSYIRYFHKHSARVLVPSKAVLDELSLLGFENLHLWGHGVDIERFHPVKGCGLDLPKPIFAYIGRVAVEKNLDAFLSLQLQGSKVVIGDGPQLKQLMRKYPDVHFYGFISNAKLPHYYASIDVFVFPSRTDTFGLVILEALACGTPVAAFPAPGPIDILLPGKTGMMSENLKDAALGALKLKRKHCREFAEQCSWEKYLQVFVNHLVMI